MQDYAASKRGRRRLLMKTLSREIAHKKIRINSFSPETIQTPINYRDWQTPEALDKLMTLIPYKRIGTPDDIGRAAVGYAATTVIM